MENQYVFVQTQTTSRGGLYADIAVMSKEGFLQSAERFNERIESGRYYSPPTYRYAELDGHGTINFKSMTAEEFETMFDESDILRMGRLMEYGGGVSGGNYPVFLKEVYVKFGYHVDDRPN